MAAETGSAINVSAVSGFREDGKWKILAGAGISKLYDEYECAAPRRGTCASAASSARRRRSGSTGALATSTRRCR